MAFKMKGFPVHKGTSGFKKETTIEQGHDKQEVDKGSVEVKPRITFKEAYEKRDMNLYGDLTLGEFTKEAKRQQAGGSVPKEKMTSEVNTARQRAQILKN